jgi:hypothetical protein
MLLYKHKKCHTDYNAISEHMYNAEKRWSCAIDISDRDRMVKCVKIERDNFCSI